MTGRLLIHAAYKIFIHGDVTASSQNITAAAPPSSCHLAVVELVQGLHEPGPLRRDALHLPERVLAHACGRAIAFRLLFILWSIS